MPADSIFTVRNEDLASLSPEGAIEFVRGLFWAEARRVGLPVTNVHISSWINVPDGGVDATIEGNGSVVKSDLIRQRHSGFQVKAGGAFEPWKESHIKQALFGEKKTPNKQNLGESVRECLEQNGAYVLICTNSDPTNQQRRKAVSFLKKYFVLCSYKNAKAEVWGCGHLIGLLQRFPSLSLQMNGRGGLRFQTHASWSQQDDMRRAFKAGTLQRDFISGVISELRRSDAAVHIRVWGEAGIGKTRLVLEAARADDLQPLVIYCDDATKFRDSDLMNEILKESNEFSAVLVIDECDPDSRSYIWNKLKNCGARMKLISIHSELDRTSGDIVYVDAPALDTEQITEIIHEYGVPREHAERWSELCGGSPRMAHMIGLNLKSNPEDLLRPPDTVNVWDRFVVAGDTPNSARVQQRRLVLRYLALFKRFGYGGKLAEEARTIARLVRQANPGVTWQRFQEVVEELRRRKILQGENTLYITPKLLHIKLWVDWWDTYGQGFNMEAFAEGLPSKLREWFHEMFRYAAESHAAQRIVRELLDESGIFQTSNYLQDPLGARYFLALSEASPEAALRCLENTLGTWSKEQLLNFTTGRREVVWTLEKIAVWRGPFPGAAKMLLKLGEAENETWGNSASGVFAALFSPGPGQVAPTEAPPEERFPVLKEALESNSKERHLLALRACNAALEAHYFTRVGGVEHQGLRREPQLWSPQTWDEVLDAYRRVWQLLCERLGILPDDERTQAVDILLGRTRGLARYRNLLDMLVDTLARLVRERYADRRIVFETVQRILHYDGKEMPVEARNRWQQLKSTLLGEDFHSLMERYVAMDLLEDRFDEEGKSVDKAGPQIDTLAAQAVQQPQLLGEELPWLITGDAKNGFRFGYALGAKDPGFSLLPHLLETQRVAGAHGSAFFLSGYVRAMHERDQPRWEGLLDELAGDEELRTWVPELTWRSRLTDRAALRILGLAKRGAIDILHFQMFGFGSVVADLAEDVLKQWIEFLLASSEREAISIALDLYHFYYCRKESKYPLPKELTLRLLTAAPLFRKLDRRRRSQMDDYYWTELGKEFVRKHSSESLELADKVLEHFGEEGTIVEGFHSSTQAVLDEITRRFPSEVWRRITKYLGPPIDSRAFRLRSWLRGDEFFPSGENGVLPIIPLEDILQWVDENVEKRAWYLASLVPKQLFRREGEVCLAREVLVRYGARRDVRGNLMANFYTEGWSGPESVHFQTKKQSLLEFRKGETNENVKRWIDEYVASLDKQIERARIEEEREH